MSPNYYTKLIDELEEIKPSLFDIIDNRIIVVRERGENEYQVHWEDNSEKPFIQVISDFEFIVEGYQNFQNGIGFEINEFLSKSSDRKCKSLLNMLRKDIWFNHNVHTKFIQEEDNFFRTYRGDKSDDYFTESILDDAKKQMTDICRKELTDSYELKFESIITYLENMSKRLDQITQQITDQTDKASKIYKFGSESLKDDPTVAMILLGVSIECQLKMKYNDDLHEKDTLGILIGKLKKSKKFPNLNYELLHEINSKYTKVKHEKTAIIKLTLVQNYYQQATVFY